MHNLMLPFTTYYHWLKDIVMLKRQMTWTSAVWLVTITHCYTCLIGVLHLIGEYFIYFLLLQDLMNGQTGKAAWTWNRSDWNAESNLGRFTALLCWPTERWRPPGSVLKRNLPWTKWFIISDALQFYFHKLFLLIFLTVFFDELTISFIDLIITIWVSVTHPQQRDAQAHVRTFTPELFIAAGMRTVHFIRTVITVMFAITDVSWPDTACLIT